MIKKIESINCASYNNYTWVSDLDEFKQINIFYGHNGAGKTILSRIMRCFELKSHHEDYRDAAFSLAINDNKTINQNNIVNPEDLNIVVYNKDFVSDNLNFLINGRNGGNIKSFSSTIIGRDNSKISKEIEDIKVKLGNFSNDEQGRPASGLYGEKERTSKSISEKEQLRKLKNQDSKLSDKAREIKNETMLNEVTYNISKIKQDIENIKDNMDIHILSQEVENQYINSLKDEIKETLKIDIEFNERDFKDILDGAKELVEVKFIPIENIENDLRKWLEEGLKFHSHDNVEQECKFCKNKLPQDRLEWLIKNLKDTRIEENNSKINFKLTKASEIRNRYQDFLSILNKLKPSNFYTEFKDESEKLKEDADKIFNNYFSELIELGRELQIKRDNPYSDVNFKNFNDYSKDVNNMIAKIKDLIDKNNSKTQNLENTKNQIRQKIKFSKIAKFLKDIEYFKNLEEEAELNKNIENFRALLEIKQQEINENEELIKSKKASMSNEQAGADKINEYLKSYFGNNMLEFRAVEGNKSEFKIYRNGNEANNLSEGECSLIGFCYFMAKLQDADKASIIWIDDPISSLDSNHIFFIFSLIDSELFDAKALKYHQLFISTHNLEFLKYIKRLRAISDDRIDKNKKVNLYLIEKDENGSHIKDMPKFLKNYTTEFNYLFEQIYNQKDISDIENEDIKTASIYNFGNNLRKFLEVYLFYKYPTVKSFGTEVIERFFESGDDKAVSSLVNRYANELSHLREIMERGMKPLDILESKKIAKFVLETIKRKDPEQYEALCESIGKSSEL